MSRAGFEVCSGALPVSNAQRIDNTPRANHAQLLVFEGFAVEVKPMIQLSSVRIALLKKLQNTLILLANYFSGGAENYINRIRAKKFLAN